MLSPCTGGLGLFLVTFDPKPSLKVSGAQASPTELSFLGSSVSLLPLPWMLLSSKDTPWIVEDGCSSLLPSSNSIPLLSPLPSAPQVPPHPVLCPHTRKHPWRASHPSLGPGWTSLAYGHPGGAGQCHIIPSLQVPRSPSPFASPQMCVAVLLGSLDSPSQSFRLCPEGLAGRSGETSRLREPAHMEVILRIPPTPY